MPVYFGDKIKEARKKAKMTQRQLADQLGIKNTSISNWEKNVSRPDPDMIALLCGVLGIEPGFLFSAGPESEQETIPAGFQSMPSMEAVPLVGRIACGTPILAEENIEEFVSIPARWKATFTLICHGSSMEPKIKDGDLVAIRSQPTVDNGQVAAVRIGNEATLKKIFQYPDRLELRPINPDYDTMVLYGEEINTAVIEGLAVGLCRGL